MPKRKGAIPKTRQQLEMSTYLCQVCQVEDDIEKVRCDACMLWYHFNCAKINQDVINQEVWMCQTCESEVQQSKSVEVPVSNLAAVDGSQSVPMELLSKDQFPTRSHKSTRSRATGSVTSSTISRKASLALQKLQEERRLAERRDSDALRFAIQRDKEYLAQKYSILEDDVQSNLSYDDEEIDARMVDSVKRWTEDVQRQQLNSTTVALERQRNKSELPLWLTHPKSFVEQDVCWTNWFEKAEDLVTVQKGSVEATIVREAQDGPITCREHSIPSVESNMQTKLVREVSVHQADVAPSANTTYHPIVEFTSKSNVRQGNITDQQVVSTDSDNQFIGTNQTNSIQHDDAGPPQSLGARQSQTFRASQQQWRNNFVGLSSIIDQRSGTCGTFGASQSREVAEGNPLKCGAEQSYRLVASNPSKLLGAIQSDPLVASNPSNLFGATQSYPLFSGNSSHTMGVGRLFSSFGTHQRNVVSQYDGRAQTVDVNLRRDAKPPQSIGFSQSYSVGVQSSGVSQPQFLGIGRHNIANQPQSLGASYHSQPAASNLPQSLGLNNIHPNQPLIPSHLIGHTQQVGANYKLHNSSQFGSQPSSYGNSQSISFSVSQPHISSSSVNNGPQIPNQVNGFHQSNLNQSHFNMGNNTGGHVVSPNISGVSVGRLTAEQIAVRHVIPKDLPHFNGDPVEWELFISAYENSTETCGFSNSENLGRLKKCLKGDARTAVRSRLLHKDSVPGVIHTLRLLYGRPESKR